MRLEGKIWKSGRFWLVEIPALDVMTQGKNRPDAIRMLKDAISLLIDKPKLQMRVLLGKRDVFFVETRQVKPLLALLLKRQRIKHHLSLADVASKMGAKSKNAYAQYEQGKSEPSLSKFQQFLQAMDRQNEVILKVA